MRYAGHVLQFDGDHVIVADVVQGLKHAFPIDLAFAGSPIAWVVPSLSEK